jgi:hypothetical protein
MNGMAAEPGIGSPGGPEVAMRNGKRMVRVSGLMTAPRAEVFFERERIERHTTWSLHAERRAQ